MGFRQLFYYYTHMQLQSKGIANIFVCNNKTTGMKRYLISLILLGLLISGNLTGQQLSVIPSLIGEDPSFRVTQPSEFPINTIDSNLPNNGGKAPRACVFMEYGDGAFTTNFNTNYLPKTAGQLTALMTFRGKYDGGHPTARIISQQYTLLSNVNTNSQHDLPEGKNIKIRSDVMDLLEYDTIQVVLTFKKTFRGSGKILFYYNDGLSGFRSISLSENPQYPNLNIFGNNTIKQVRTYSPFILHCENISVCSQMSTSACSGNTSPGSSILIPGNSSMITKINEINETQFTNLMMCNVSGDLPSWVERNIFITLITTNNVKTSVNAETAIRAYILPDEMQASAKNIGPVSPEFSELKFSTIPFDPSEPEALRPHDPNYIISKSTCLQSRKCTPGSRWYVAKVDTIDYKVHFQNDGRGTADSINVDVYFPALKFDIRDINSIRNISANVAGKNIIGKNRRINVRRIIARREQFVIVRFTLLNPYEGQKKSDTVVNLIGGESTPMGNIDPNTMGEINFSVSTQRTVPCYTTYANIFFNRESPIRTKTYNLKYCGDKIKCSEFFDCDGNPKAEIKVYKKITNGKIH